MWWIYVLIGIVVVIGLLLIAAYTKAGPDEAIMISGLGKRKILRGRAGMRIPFFQRKDRLSLKAFQVDIKTRESIPTNEFINIMVDGVANLKISSNPQLLERSDGVYTGFLYVADPNGWGLEFKFQLEPGNWDKQLNSNNLVEISGEATT